MNSTNPYPFNPPLQLTKFSPYVTISEFLNEMECRRLVKLMKTRQSFRGKVEGAEKNSPVENKKFRDSTICGIHLEQETAWIFQKLQGAIQQVNFDVWGYELYGFHEGIQLARYSTGDFYGWHMDIGNGALSQRKVSIVIQLSDGSEYEGGDLEFFQHGCASRDQGTLILFPSFIHHQVLPITAGERHSLVAWINGNPYR